MRTIIRTFFLGFLLLPILLFASGKEEIKVDSSAHALVAPEGNQYQWFRNNEPLVGERGRELSVLESGNYQSVSK